MFKIGKIKDTRISKYNFLDWINNIFYIYVFVSNF